MKSDIINLFPSSVHLIDIENYDLVKEESLSFIYQEQENNPSSVYKSNKGGWQSDSYYHQWDNIIKKIVDKGLSKHSEFYLDYKKFVNKTGLQLALNSYKQLEKDHDLIIIEGAGSPAEINLIQYDIANMKIAEKTNSNVILITDIERGGSFASLVGTMELIEKKYQKLVKGFVFNKFRGDKEILKPGFRKLKQKTKKPVLGTIPLTKFSIPDEDSIGDSPKKLVWNKPNLRKLDVEIDKISNVVRSSLNISGIKRILK